MVFVDDNYGKFQLIDFDDDFDDGEIVFDVIFGIKYVVIIEGVQNDEDVGVNFKLGFIVILLLDFIYYFEEVIEN